MALSIKKLTLCTSLAFSLAFSSAVGASEIKMKPEHRRALLSGVTKNVTDEYLRNDPTTSGCWQAAKNGDDVSLLAIYIIAKSTPIMVKYRDAMNRTVKSSGTVSERYQIMREAYDSLNVEEAGWYLQRVPAAVIHCLEVSGGIDLSAEKEALAEGIREGIR